MKALILFILVASSVFAGNTWIIDAEANAGKIQDQANEFARGESWNIAARVMDDGVPRQWPTNATFVFFWQKSNMTTNWWASTNVSFPVYKTVTVATTSAVVTTYITNMVIVTYPTTNSVGTTNTLSTTNSFITYNKAYTTGQTIDVGRVSAKWDASMDVGANSYNWFIGEFENSLNPCYRISGTITIRGAPGYGGTFLGTPLTFPWATTNFVTNAVGQVQAYALWAVTNGAPAGYWSIMSPYP